IATLLPVTRGAEHQVTVGGPGILQYNPQFVTADPGDVVVFTFKQKNHTTTQSSFDSPCVQAPGGFDSGFIPVADNNTDGPFPVAQFTVEDTNPVWVYCKQANHCQQGMVFAINPGDKFDAFQSAAKGLAASTASASASTVASSTTAPPPSGTATGVVTVTATVTVSGTQAVTTTYASYPGSAAPTSASSSDHRVMVGAGGLLTFNPSNITAQVGDTITFVFAAKNHTATQSNFANPCTSLTQSSTSGQVGFDSGFMPVPNGTVNFPTYTIQVNDTAPIWAFCRQTTPVSHCAQGMVFAANAVESGANTFEAFEAKAKASVSSSGNSTSSALSLRTSSYAG
ncbi:Cupredoxin, partial [Abortiporus biennis]